MLFLVVSSPAPDLNEEVQRKRREFRGWIRELEAQGKVRHYYPRIARGSVVVFDVASNEELHGLLSRWLGRKRSGSWNDPGRRGFPPPRKGSSDSPGLPGAESRHQSFKVPGPLL